MEFGAHSLDQLLNLLHALNKF